MIENDFLFLVWPQYTYAGDSSLGYYNLHISDVQVMDQGKYECQVLTKYNDEPVQMCSTKAMLTVLGELICLSALN